MIETGNLSEFNKASTRPISACIDAEIVAILSKDDKSFPNIRLLLTKTTEYYTENFSDLLKHIKREKRLVVFDTPSRVSMTHEYTIEGMGYLSQGFYYLFNTRERLSWLRISLEDKRISIASRAKVVSLLIKKLGKELEDFAARLSTTKEDLAFRLYDISDGKPCFVEFNQKEYRGQQSLLLSITYFDSIRNKKLHRNRIWWSPLKEKRIRYNYSTVSRDANAWIDFKSPTNFVLSANHNVAENQIEASPSNDDEIKSYVLIPKGEKLSVDFEISVNVPNALKVWYLAMLYLAIAGVLFGGCIIALRMCSAIPDKMIEIFSNCSLAIIAALIATRGWLMSEEQVMKIISNCYTTIIGILLALVLALSFVPNSKPDNTTKPQSSIPQDSSTVIATPQCPLIKKTQNKIKDTVNKKSNGINKITVKTYDSSSIKNPSERTPAPPKKRTL